MGAIQTVHDGWNHNDIVKDGYSHKIGWHNGKIVWAKDFFSFKTLDSMVSEDGEVVRKGSITLNITDQVLIDWGDGTETHKSDRYTIEHAYPTDNMTEYTVKIYGVINVFTGYINIDGKTCSCITEILSPLQESMSVYQYNQTLISMFADCATLRKIPQNLFERFMDKENVNANGMFSGSGLEELPVGLFLNMKNIAIFNIFAECNNLTTVIHGVFSGGTFYGTPFKDCVNLFSVYDYPYGISPSFDGCTSLEIIGCVFGGVTSFYGAFDGLTSLKQVSSNIFSDSEGATTFEKCFYGCTSLESIPVGLFDGLENVETFESCFYRCVGLKTVPSDLFDDCYSAKNYKTAFYDCKGITSNVPTLWENENILNHSQCYYNCVNAANYSDIPDTWK